MRRVGMIVGSVVLAFSAVGVRAVGDDARFDTIPESIVAALEATKDLDADATPDEPWLRSWCAPVTEAIDRMCEWAS